MPCSPSFVEHALDLVSALGPVQERRLFGGHGLYCDGVMFGLLDDDDLFLKTDAETRPWFLEASCRMWTFPGATQTGYYRPPDDAHEDAEAMLPWARLALDAALRAQAATGRKPRAAGAGARRRKAKAARATSKPKAKPAKARAKATPRSRAKARAAARPTKAPRGATRPTRRPPAARPGRRRPAGRRGARPGRAPR